MRQQASNGGNDTSCKFKSAHVFAFCIGVGRVQRTKMKIHAQPDSPRFHSCLDGSSKKTENAPAKEAD